MSRKIIAKLPENRELRSGWFVFKIFFTPAVWQAKRLQASLFSSLLWDACDYRFYIELSYGAYDGIPSSLYFDLVIDTFDAFSGYWGEIADVRMTGRPTFCSLDGNVSEVPHLSTANLWNTEYVKFLGGFEKFRMAGFDKLIQTKTGLLTQIDANSGPEEFYARQKQIEINFDGGRPFLAIDELPSDIKQ